MTQEQAAAEFARLCRTFDKNPRDMAPERVSAWIRELMALPYEKGRLAINETIAQWDKASFPPPGFFVARAKEIGFEGRPNAGAYSQDGQGPAPISGYSAWRQDRIVSMDDEDYWAYLDDYRRWKNGGPAPTQERQWQSDFNEQIRRPHLRALPSGEGGSA